MKFQVVWRNAEPARKPWRGRLRAVRMGDKPALKRKDDGRWFMGVIAQAKTVLAKRAVGA